MNRELIRKTEDFLKEKYNEGAYLNSHPSDKAYRLEHSYRVANICRLIAEREGFDVSIGDADNIDRLDAYRIYEGLQYSKFSDMTLDEKKERVSLALCKLENLHVMDLGTETAKFIWNGRIDFNVAFYEKLRDQLANSWKIL